MFSASMPYLMTLIHDLIDSYQQIFITIKSLDPWDSAEPYFYLILPKFITHIKCDMQCMNSEQNNFICSSIWRSSISCCVLHGTAGVDCLISVTLNFHNLSIRNAGKCWEADILKIISTEFLETPGASCLSPFPFFLHSFSLSVWAVFPWVRKIEFLVSYLKLLYNCLTL